jgi:cell wall-associated NlpC family hydrolase
MAPVPSLSNPTNPKTGKAALELLQPGSIWQLEWPLNLYSRAGGRGLATQAAAGRCLEVLSERSQGRLRVRLLEDGYPGWLEPGDLMGRAVAAARPRPLLLQRAQINQRLPQVLALALSWMERPNVYLWGGTIGPDLDCSGLVQTAYAAAGIWLPRDAYLQERFCQPVAVLPGQTQLLEPGDLVFFGTPQRCTHVGLHLGGGRYLHSSGQQHGRNGLGIDDLNPRNSHPVASHYRQELRGAGRVMHGHDGSPLPA